ncbi:MAG: LytTR family DNA-binding domain-containing protein [Bacteroidetes bacterium]|nr:LytTR family DNA-binding domain-containing protein [Bacteroidota bacterium]
MKFIAIDDEPMALDIITDYASKVPYLELAGKFRNAVSALEYLQSNTIDLIFLDINMPDLTGIQMLKTIQNPPMVIFTTAYSEYALESYQFHAIDYLLKPIDFEQFLKAVNHANEQFLLKNRQRNKSTLISETTDKQHELIWVKSGTEYFKINLNEIFYIKSEGNYVEFHLQNKRIVSLDSLNNLTEKLPSNSFARIHKSYIVAIKHIESFERHQVKIKNESLPVSTLYRGSFLRIIKG